MTLADDYIIVIINIIEDKKVNMEKIKLTVEGRKLSLNFKDHFVNLVRINQSLNEGVKENYQKQGLTYMDVPEIVGITGACENIDTLFKVQNRLTLLLFITQTGQLNLEQSLQSFPGVWTVIHSGRDEKEEDERHLRQFRLTEEEFDSSLVRMTRRNYNEDRMYEALLFHIQSAIQSIIKKVLKGNGHFLKNVYHRNIAKLQEAAIKKFLRVSYEEAIEILQKNGYPEICFGDDLKAGHEATIVAYLNHNQSELPVFIMKYPKEIKFFNMKVSTKDPCIVLSADLIFPYAGEGVGAAVREHEFSKLNTRLITSEMYRLHLQRGGKYENFKWYLDIIKQKKTNPHAGYGIGNERVLQYIFGESDIRNVSIFSLLNLQTGDWDTAKYGEGAIILPPKRHILLTIGRVADKKFLLPYIKKLIVQDGVVFYVTKHTYDFFRKNQVMTSLVYKIFETGKRPNISDLLERKVFDLIINIPRSVKKKSREMQDARLIRKMAIDRGITLITNIEVAAMVIENLAK